MCCVLVAGASLHIHALRVIDTHTQAAAVSHEPHNKAHEDRQSAGHGHPLPSSAAAASLAAAPVTLLLPWESTSNPARTSPNVAAPAAPAPPIVDLRLLSLLEALARLSHSSSRRRARLTTAVTAAAPLSSAAAGPVAAPAPWRAAAALSKATPASLRRGRRLAHMRLAVRRALRLRRACGQRCGDGGYTKVEGGGGVTGDMVP